MGDVSDIRKQILQNTLTDELKKHFRIVPQEKYKQVLEQVFEELEYEECNEDTCIMRIQEILQVENVFNLQILGEGKDTQLNLKWITLDEKKNEEDYCRSCGTYELRKMIGGLVEKLVGVKRVEVVVQKKGKVVLYYRIVNGEWGRNKSGDEKEDGKYEGEVENGLPNGQGTITWSNGEKYVGKYKDGKRNGQGTETFPDGQKYVGSWKDGIKWNGIEYHKDGEITYKFVNGKREQVVVEKEEKGVLYERKDYFGWTWYNSGNEKEDRKYVGEIENGKPNGQGSETAPDGTKYVGEWKDGNQHGQGTYTFPDGAKYVGEYKDGKRNGQGTFTFLNGDKGIGEFRDDNPWNITDYDKNGNIIGKFVNGEEIKQ